MTNFNHTLQRLAERYQQRKNPAELKSELLQLVAEINDALDGEKIVPLLIGQMAKERLRALTNPTYAEQHLLKTCFTEYDELFGGISKGELTIIGARPGMGKTTFMVNLCANMASRNIPVAYISMELSNFQVANRFISHLSKLSLHELSKTPLAPKQVFRVQEAVEQLSYYPVYVYDQHNSSVFDITERIRFLKEQHQVELVMIDYLQMVTAAKNKYRDAELAFITRQFKKLAKELNIAIVASSQLSRQVENRPGGSKRPILSDLRESGAIEQDADKVIFLYRPEYYGLEFDENNESTRQVMELIMAKNTSGNLETFKLRCEKYFTGFNDYGDFLISNDRLTDLD